MNNELTTNNNIFGGSQQLAAAKTTTTEMVSTRQAQEVQAAMVVAKRFPRDEIEAYNRIMRACQRKSLAEQSCYEYPRGGQKVTGPSIRLAEALAQNWGNLDYGIIELEQKDGESQVMAYAWDLETNTRQTKIFSVPHMRVTKTGSKTLTDPRDIYELVANQGSRRLRACILGVIPGDVIDSAIDQCNLTLRTNNPEPLILLIIFLPFP
jgi:anion-transporting  ArsA/GET3 family ATPase